MVGVVNSPPSYDKGAMERLFERVKNWGRWGPEDERGTLNLITPEGVERAARLIREGNVISLGQDILTAPEPDEPTPARHMMIVAGDCCSVAIPGYPETTGYQQCVDYVATPCHSMALTHIDALCHVFVDGLMYNGYPASTVLSIGATRNSLAAAVNGIVGRGVLLDIPGVTGRRWLEPSEPVLLKDLVAACEAQRVSVEPGDILLISTGRDARRDALGRIDPFVEGLSGLHPETILWLREHDIAVLGSDGISDCLPFNPTEGWPIPVHQCCIASMGVHLIDAMNLGPLGAACKRASRWEFYFSLQPLRLTRATGSPVNPVAVL